MKLCPKNMNCDELQFWYQPAYNISKNIPAIHNTYNVFQDVVKNIKFKRHSYAL